MSNEQVVKTETKTMTREQFESSLKNDQLAPEDVAAAFFTLEYPRFRIMLDNLSRKELVRLCLNLAGNEYVPEQNKLKSEKEKQAFYVGNQMVHNRAIMQLSYEMQRAEEAQKLLDEREKLKQETNNPKQGE